MTVREEDERLILRSEGGTNVTMKAILFIAITFACLTLMGAISLVSGRSTGQDIVTMKGNNVGFLWALATVVMLVAIPWYLSKLHKPTFTLELLKKDRSVRREGSIVTRFDKVEFVAVSEGKDSDSRYNYTVALVYGDGQELVLAQSYEERNQLALADRLAGYIGTRVQCSPSLEVAQADRLRASL
ncbi:MAG: hypothetical protein QM758_09130 [Armatimonas sp.]